MDERELDGILEHSESGTSPPACGADSAVWLLYARLILLAVVLGPASVALYIGWRILIYFNVAHP